MTIRDPFWFVSLVSSGATIGSIAGLSALVLAILGLSGVQPMHLLPVAGAVLGLAFLMLGAVDSAWARMIQSSEREASQDQIVPQSGLAAVLIAGLIAVVVSTLNFVFLGNVRFGAATVIALGVGLLWHSGVTRRVSQLTYFVTYRGEGRGPSGPFAMNALSMAPVRDFLVGMIGMILGILAMMNVAPVALAFVALLMLGLALTATISTTCGAALSIVKGVAGRA